MAYRVWVKNIEQNMLKIVDTVFFFASEWQRIPLKQARR